MKEVDLEQPGDLADFINSKFDKVPASEPTFQKFSYQRPALSGRKTRAGVRLALTDIMFAVVQVLEKGGEPVMHSHAAMDGLWLVLKGRARFYDARNNPHEFGPLEGLCIPRGTKYWFEKVGDEPLEILQCDARHPGIKNTVSFENLSADQLAAEEGAIAIFDAQKA